MILQIANVIPDPLLASCQNYAANRDLFVDGRSTAGWHARNRKNNLQRAALLLSLQ